MIYIYALVCPNTERIRYVGKCKDIKSRLSAHVSKAKGEHTKHHCAHWIRSLIQQGLRPRIVVLKELPDGSHWQAAEIEEISRQRALGNDLTNATSGGDGFPDLDKETLRKRTLSRMLWLERNKEQFLATLAASHARPDARESHRQGAKSAWSDPVKRENMLAAMRTPEALARRAEATKRRNANPEFATRHRETMKRISAEPEGRERMKKARDIRWKGTK